ncbi:hypothetical protein [Parasitella parasitica]|uniref:C2H2-type domain-containing protein n=1 Tax=Parasitella parasitica TaxID=35722 RepID=A0A0B7MWP1_9FUNG|nr:hypothetical protein [Parasitella parasitica]
MKVLQSHCRNGAVKSSPYANTISAAQVYYPPSQTEIDMIQGPAEHWFQQMQQYEQQQQQQVGISPSSSGLSRADSYSPCSTPMNNLDDTHLASSCTPSFSSSAHHVPLVDPMVFGKSNIGATAVTSNVLPASQYQSVYQQPMVMPLFQPETQAHHEKLLSQYTSSGSVNRNTNHGPMAVSNHGMNASYTTMYGGLGYSAIPASSNMYSTSAQNGMIPSNNSNSINSDNNTFVSYHHDYNPASIYNNNNHASIINPSSMPAFSMNPHHSNQQFYSHYADLSKNNAYSVQNSTRHEKLCEIKCNSHHQQSNHLMTTTVAKEDVAYVSSSPSTSDSCVGSNNSSSASSISSSNMNDGIEHKQSNNTTQQAASIPCPEPDCYKMFSRPYNLKSHMKTHTQERPFACVYKPCHWRFARFHDLKRHELQHTGQKPHECRFCNKRFARSDALKRHWKVDPKCTEAWKQDIVLNGGTSAKLRRRNKSNYQALN